MGSTPTLPTTLKGSSMNPIVEEFACPICDASKGTPCVMCGDTCGGRLDLFCAEGSYAARLALHEESMAFLTAKFGHDPDFMSELAESTVYLTGQELRNLSGHRLSALNTYHISGHIDLDPNEFTTHYVPAIDQALSDPLSCFVVGDCRGADAMAQAYLAAQIPQHAVTQRVVVYHMFDSPRTNAGGFPLRGGFTSDTERDEAMTSASTHDIAWIRPGR